MSLDLTETNDHGDEWWIVTGTDHGRPWHAIYYLFEPMTDAIARCERFNTSDNPRGYHWTLVSPHHHAGLETHRYVIFRGRSQQSGDP